MQRATAAALKLSSASEHSLSTGNELLADIQRVFERRRVHKISTVELIQALVADDEQSWATYNRGKPLSPRQLARQLAAYGIKPKTIRQQYSTPKGYDASQFEDAFARYLAAPSNVPPQRNGSPEAMTGKEGGVADKTQHSSDDDAAGALADKTQHSSDDDAAGALADDARQFRNFAATLEATSTLDFGDFGGVSDESERGPEAGATDVF
jgi:hypothetical protein